MANIKLTGGNTWDTSGIYDATEQKTQDQINADIKEDVDDLKSAVDNDVYHRYTESRQSGLSLDMFDVCPAQYSITTYQDTDCVKHSAIPSGTTYLVSRLKPQYKDIKFRLHYGFYSTSNPVVKLTFACKPDGSKALNYNINVTSNNVGVYDTGGGGGVAPGIYRNSDCRNAVQDDQFHFVINGTKVALYLVDNGVDVPVFEDEFVDIVDEYGSYGFTESDISLGLMTNNSARNEYLMYDFSYGTASGDHFMSYDETDARLTALENGIARPGVVDLFMFMGQSNMAGRGNSSQAPEVEEGAGYEFRAISDPTKLYPIAEPFGRNENDANGINDAHGDVVMKSGSMVSAFANAYYKHTGCPVVGVSASEGGTRISHWLPDTSRYTDAVSRYNDAADFLTENDCTIRHKYILWCQGESDGDDGTSKADYKTAFAAIAEAWFALGIEKIFMVKIGNYNGESGYDYNTVMTAQNEICQETPNVVMVSTDFASMKDRELMKDDFHYTQAAYNEVGTFAGINTALYVNTGKEPTMYDTQDGTLYFSHKN